VLVTQGLGTAQAIDVRMRHNLSAVAGAAHAGRAVNERQADVNASDIHTCVLTHFDAGTHRDRSLSHGFRWSDPCSIHRVLTYEHERTNTTYEHDLTRIDDERNFNPFVSGD
jgi:hypothetical protein